MKSDQLTPDVVRTRSGFYPMFFGVVRKNGEKDGEVVWRSEQQRQMRAHAWEDAERGVAMMTVVQAHSEE